MKNYVFSFFKNQKLSTGKIMLIIKKVIIKSNKITDKKNKMK